MSDEEFEASANNQNSEPHEPQQLNSPQNISSVQRPVVYHHPNLASPTAPQSAPAPAKSPTPTPVTAMPAAPTSAPAGAAPATPSAPATPASATPDATARQVPPELAGAYLQKPQPTSGMQAQTGKSKKRKKNRKPGWFALIIAVIIATILGGTLGVGVMTLRYDGTRPAILPAKAKLAPVVESDGEAPDWIAVANAVGASVVAIEAQQGNGASAGSGVIIDDKGHILTNDHVIAGSDELFVTLHDGRIFEAEVAGTDSATDLAVLTLKNPPEDLTIAQFADSTQIVVGQPVSAIGNPLGLSFTMTSGIVSALDRPVQTLNDQARSLEAARVVTNAIQLDAAVNPGNSGGPVFDENGRVVGIASSIATMSQSASNSGGSIGLGFAIPSNLAKNISQQLIENGVAEHAYLGVIIRDGVANYGGNHSLGAIIEEIEKNTPAEKAKLRKGDVVVAVNGRTVVSAVSLTGYVRQYQSGDTITLTIARNGDLQELDVVLATKIDEES